MKNQKIIQGGGVIPFKKFSKEENEVWKLLCEKQMKNLRGKATKLHKQGWDALGMSTEYIPNFLEINKKLKKLTSWEIEMTDITYENNVEWVGALADKKHRITNFIRKKKDLDYTPLPDIFHDVFGHVPFLAIPQYARILEKFGRAIVKAKNKENKDHIAKLGWYGYEFGLIKEDGEIKAFGTGLMSSSGELQNAFSEKVLKVPYDEKVIRNLDISPHEFHRKLFILENLDHLEEVVNRWLK
ncbi:hypothetical protein A2733_01190 [Candidatus Nomurabacteria bacterium RIFCSPHIGHO2_01_FULL_40_20]|uniref:Biopterin-dependent aromatic amino acid hydroxylase family profile domain-containing protein n=1 Tax=Candidatus Nomurabacteria bacterium RIFCSPHIGHO2_01_FULL_40_20 TaxID=1801738 RepID=A0A1F6V4M8_9BACT|nr:MAG: hypothetical protein A2733_01190 [Candidatus Nomurabacteria bacterium RIFCSPHIGHO2_01_FULL_40_20]